MLAKSETWLIDKLIKGDKAAFRQFYRQTYHRLLSWIEAKVSHQQDAEEVTQDVYLSFLDSLPLFEKHSSLWTFLIAIAKHEVADYWRKKYAKRAILTIPYADQIYTEKLYSSGQMSYVIEAVFARMLPDQVKILRFKYEQDLTVAEIAQKLGVTLKAAESKLFRARKAFQLLYLSTQTNKRYL